MATLLASVADAHYVAGWPKLEISSKTLIGTDDKVGYLEHHIDQVLGCHQHLSEKLAYLTKVYICPNNIAKVCSNTPSQIREMAALYAHKSLGFPCQSAEKTGFTLATNTWPG